MIKAGRDPLEERARGERRIAHALSDGSRRRVLVAFTVAQLLDFATTVVGLLRGLSETNPLTAGLVARWGTPGLLLAKVPVVIAMGFGLAFLPRRAGIAAAWAFTAVVGLVVLQNLAQLATAQR